MMSKEKVMSKGIGRTTILLLAVIVVALTLSSGVALAATITCQAGVDCLGTRKADTLEGTDSKDIMYGRGGGDTLKGFGNVDQLYGQAGKDTLSGGSEIDYLIGGAGNDALKGGSGFDRYLFGPAWGNDSITGDTDPDSEIRFFSDILQDTPVTDDLIIDLRSDAGPEAKNTNGTNTVNWEGDRVNSVFGGTGDDQITGNASANAIIGYYGDDTISGGQGEDEINVYDTSGGDTVHCGPGEDTVLYDVVLIGIAVDSIDSDCEHKVANP